MRRGRDSRDVLAQRKGFMRTSEEDSHLRAKERGLKRNQTCQHLDLGLPTSTTMRTKPQREQLIHKVVIFSRGRAWPVQGGASEKSMSYFLCFRSIHLMLLHLETSMNILKMLLVILTHEHPPSVTLLHSGSDTHHQTPWILINSNCLGGDGASSCLMVRRPSMSLCCVKIDCYLHLLFHPQYQHWTRGNRKNQK